jgi:hypothetical protein
MLDEEYAPLIVDHQRAHAKRQAPRKPPVEVENAAQCRFKNAPEAGKIHKDPITLAKLTTAVP